ncbi:hypothetical protein [Xanthomonas albilineans]|nr:hypothetical protein [Xanthomonas albilineans]
MKNIEKRAQQRYQEFLDADSGMPFGEWIRHGKPSVQEGGKHG